MRLAVSFRSVASPAVEPYCSAAWPSAASPSNSLSSRRLPATGSVALSVKPAASEISLGRSSLMRISHEIGGSAVRRAIAERALGFEIIPAI